MIIEQDQEFVMNLQRFIELPLRCQASDLQRASITIG